MKILILGGGVAAHRYVESLIWTDHEIHIAGIDVIGKSKQLSAEYSIPYFKFDYLDVETVRNYDMLIVCLSLDRKYDILLRIIKYMGYKNCIIIEKPLCTSEDELQKYFDLLSPLERCSVACQRDFDLSNYRIDKSNSYQIIWHSIYESLSANIMHMLPHLLSWLMLEVGKNIQLKKNDDYLVGTIDNKKLEIYFIKSKDSHVSINGINYKSPNYRVLNRKIIEQVYLFKKEDSNNNLERAINVSKLICELNRRM